MQKLPIDVSTKKARITGYFTSAALDRTGLVQVSIAAPAGYMRRLADGLSVRNTMHAQPNFIAQFLFPC
ncbi:hypothetical protein [Nitrosomonas sp. Nm51]|uniref:hypothetical protein n=1 Tax=Nitrosomonas sp. Nm51 TaxID=133720 RepID=UPI001C4307C1|nr:hypothetical protein [Nitrosomonas sp. Nm51]